MSAPVFSARTANLRRINLAAASQNVWKAQVFEYEEVPSKGKTSAENLKVRR
jgi:hypothetical protein